MYVHIIIINIVVLQCYSVIALKCYSIIVACFVAGTQRVHKLP